MSWMRGDSVVLDTTGTCSRGDLQVSRGDLEVAPPIQLPVIERVAHHQAGETIGRPPTAPEEPVRGPASALPRPRRYM
jgi:hypothetical protein